MPKLLHGKTRSRCCNEPMIIVLSRDGGFVTQNCRSCQKPRRVRLADLPVLNCECCETVLEPFKRQNYFYRCPNCRREQAVANLVPHWSEQFDECGFGLDSDHQRLGFAH